LGQALPVPFRDEIPWPGEADYIAARLEAHRVTTVSTQSLPLFVHEAKRTGAIKHTVPLRSATLSAGASLPASAETVEGLLAWLFPHPYLRDGSGADRPWLQEIPETSTAITWGSWAEINQATANELGLQIGDAITLSRGDVEITVPVIILKQVKPGVVAVPIGQGHESLGRWASGVGENPLRMVEIHGGTLSLQGFAVQATARPGEGTDLARTTFEQDQRGRHLARSIPLSQVENPDHWLETHQQHYDHRNLDSMYERHRYPQHDWGMAIDLDACVGCGACVVACHAENNVPFAGADGIRAGREMAWINIQRYVEEGSDEVNLLVSLCQHCHVAPCEPVCPVHAAYHTVEGLNGQVYNRCVGTRYCANNCTYKVRRFNYWDHTVPAPLELAYNPDVTVRERGVMEKCTLCIQRIREGKEEADRRGEDVGDGAIQPACAQTCPAKAFTFGDLLRERSAVRRLSESARGYALLGDLGTRPSITYLAKVTRGDSSDTEGSHH
ncbi:4Fe-4S dicluster domain-containing protein, partial [Candidatus Sumerlaeota bacterium]|nr:4Fe-4S dicluster domain-containing protein [Candidatus Sumerlaeota bacterium]